LFYFKGLMQNATFASDSNKLQIIIQENVEENTILEFEIYDFLNPNSMGTHYNIDFYVLDTNSGYMLQFRNSSFQLYIPNVPEFALISSLNRQINQITEINFTIIPLSFLLPNSSLIIRFPNEFSLDGICLILFKFFIFF